MTNKKKVLLGAAAVELAALSISIFYIINFFKKDKASLKNNETNKSTPGLSQEQEDKETFKLTPGSLLEEQIKKFYKRDIENISLFELF